MVLRDCMSCRPLPSWFAYQHEYIFEVATVSRHFPESSGFQKLGIVQRKLTLWMRRS